MNTTAGICSTSARYLASTFGSCASLSLDHPWSGRSGGYTTRLAVARLWWRLKTPAKARRISSASEGVRSRSATAEGGSMGVPFALCGHENETMLTPQAPAFHDHAQAHPAYFLGLSCALPGVGLRQLGSLFSDDCVKRRKA